MWFGIKIEEIAKSEICLASERLIWSLNRNYNATMGFSGFFEYYTIVNSRE